MPKGEDAGDRRHGEEREQRRADGVFRIGRPHRAGQQPDRHKHPGGSHERGQHVAIGEDKVAGKHDGGEGGIAELVGEIAAVHAPLEGDGEGRHGDEKRREDRRRDQEPGEADKIRGRSETAGVSSAQAGGIAH